MNTAAIDEYVPNQTNALRSGFRPKLSADAPPIVFVIHDDTSVREWLETLMRNEGWRPEIYASAQEFLARPRAVVPKCLVLDLYLSKLNSLDLQARLAIERPDMPIMFIADHSDVPTTVKAMKAGAVGFFTKPFDDDLLLSSVQEALDRSRVVIALEAEMGAFRDRYALLTTRERQVMALVVSGLLNKQVGDELGISEITVKSHRGQVMQKMKANSLADLVKIAARLDVAAVPKAVSCERRMETTNGENARTASRNCEKDVYVNHRYRKQEIASGPMECRRILGHTVACLSGNYARNRR